MDNLFTPRFFSCFNWGFEASPGFASRVNSSMFSKPNLLSMHKSTFSISLAFIKLGVPPPIKIVLNFHSDVSIEHCSISLHNALINLGIKPSFPVIE